MWRRIKLVVIKERIGASCGPRNSPSDWAEAGGTARHKNRDGQEFGP